MKKAVLFDLDGVLVDACDWHYESLNRALDEVAGYRISREDHLSTFNGLPTKTKLSELVIKGVLGLEDFERVSDLKQEYTVDVINEYCKYSNEKASLIIMLKTSGYVVGCVTNSIRRTAELMLERTGILDLLDVVVTNEDTKRNKPYPDPYLEALRLLDADELESIIVEDSPKGLEAARLTLCNVLQVKDATEVTKDLFRGVI